MKYDEARQASLKTLTNDEILLWCRLTDKSRSVLSPPSNVIFPMYSFYSQLLFVIQLLTSNSFNATTVQCIYFSKYFEGKPEAHSLWVQNFNLEKDVLLIFPPFPF